MKIKHEDKDASGKLKFNIEQLEQLKKYGLFGIPKEDRKGHTAHISLRVQPLQVDKIEAIKEKIPGWYKSNSELYRAVMAAGTFVVLCLADREYDVETLKGILKDMNFIAMSQKLRDMKRQVADLRKAEFESESTPEEKGQTLKVLKLIENRLTEIIKTHMEI